MRRPSLHRTLTYRYVPGRDSVPFRTKKSPVSLSPDRIAVVTGLGRLGLGGAFLVAPITSVRVLGLDTATAKRVIFLARMTAGRDIVLGAGALLSRDRKVRAGWIAAGAAADVVDSVAIGAALKNGTARGIPAVGITVGAAGAAALGFWAAAGLRRR